MAKRIVVAGSRHFNDYDTLEKYISEFISRKIDEEPIIFVSGGCRGADSLGEHYAKLHGYQAEVYPAEWSKYGKAAGVKRNKLMVDISDFIICFWNGSSKGTKSLIEYAGKVGKAVYIKYI